MSHTKGPWTTKENQPYQIRSDVRVEAGEQISIPELDIELINTNVELNRANAQLLAAAPEMLEACIEAERLLAEISYKNGMTFFRVIYLLRDAINKAEGK